MNSLSADHEYEGQNEMDFEEAISSHAAWKQKLGAYLAKPDQSVSATNLEKDYACDLGKWIEAEGKNFAGNPEFAKLKEEHTRFHRAAADVVRRADSGQSISEEIALGAASPYASSSMAVVRALIRMKHVAALAPK